MATIGSLITTGYEEIGVLGEGQTMTAAQGTFGLNLVNRMLGQWKAEGLQMFVIIRDTADLTPNTAFFNVGAGAAHIDIPRPLWFEKVNFQDTSVTPAIEYQLPPLMTEQEWQGVMQKDMTSVFPTRAYYGPRFPLGRLRPWPIPTSDTLEWVLYYRQQVEEFAALSDDVELPPGYDELIVTQVALRLASSSGRTVDPELKLRAINAKTIVERSNFRQVELTFPKFAQIGNGGLYDIRTDTFR